MFFVLFNHTETMGYKLFTVRQDSYFYFGYLFFSILCKVSVPLFFMVSGALLLQKEEDIRILYKKRILKFVFILVAFSFIQYLYKVVRLGEDFHIEMFFAKLYSYRIATAYWYLYAYIAFLVMLPILRRMVKAMTEQEFIYLGTCQFLISGVLPVVQFLIWKGEYTLSHWFSVSLIVSWNTYFTIMGYYFENKLEDSYYNKKKVVLWTILSFSVITVCSIMTKYAMNLTGNMEEPYPFHKSMIAIPTFTFYVWIRYFSLHTRIPARIKTFIFSLGGGIFGIMLFENIFRREFRWVFDMMEPSIRTLPACLVYIFVVYFSSFIFVSFLRKIHFIQKLI